MFAVALILFTAAPRAPGQTSTTGWGHALWFDGNDDHVTVEPGVHLANTSFTIEFRAQQVGVPGFQVVFSQGTTDGLQIGFKDGSRITFRLQGDDLDASISGDALWHHWAFTFNAADRARKIYRDGVQIAFDNVQLDYQGTNPILMGGLAGQLNYSFAGRIDEVRLWSVARNVTEIATNQNHPLTGAEPNLTAYWNFDEGSGPAVSDLTGHGYSGVIAGDPEWMRTTPGGYVLSVSNVNQYVSATIPVLASNYTFSAWIFLRTGGSTLTFPVGVLSAARCGDSMELLIRALAGGPTSAPQYLQISRCGVGGGELSTGRVPTNQWVHVAVTVSTNNQVAYYIDGIAAGTWDGSPYNLSLGPTITLADNTVRRFNGLLDEVQIWNVARTQADIVQDFVRSRGEGDPNLVAYFRFDEGTGAKAYNLGLDPRPARLEGEPTWVWLTPTVPYPVSRPAAGQSISIVTLPSWINPNGHETTAWLDWGPSPSYGNRTASVSLGSGTELLSTSELLEELELTTTYHYRATASNALGVVYGADRTFNLILVTNRSGPGSLRDSMAEAANGDVIVITNTGFLFVCCAVLKIDKDLSIVGPGANQLWLDAEHYDRVFRIETNAIATLSGLTVMKGHAPDGTWGTTAEAPGTPGEPGGGIYNAGHLTLSECVLTDNYAGSGGRGYGDEFASKPVNGGNGKNGGAGGNGGGGGGIYNAKSGVLWLDGCTIAYNRSGYGNSGGFGERGGDSVGIPGAGGTGGAGGHGGSGAGLLNDGVATLKNCTINDNVAGSGGNSYPGGRGGDNLPNSLGIHLHWGGNGGYGGTGGSGGSGGGLAGNGQTTLINCTLSGNKAGSAGEGGDGGGGGSSGGLASWGHVGGGGDGGDGGTGGGIFNNGSLELFSCTIADNTSGLGAAGGVPSTSGTTGGGPGAPGDDGTGGGIHNVNTKAASMANTVVALNTGASYPNVAGAFAYLGRNRTSGDPLLGPLANNGGPTLTREPHPTSPLINDGHNLEAPATDQRGLPRIVGGTIDIGACEFQSPQSIISYAWLRQNGLALDGSADFADPDGDHMNNWEEWRCGTYPFEDFSVLRIYPPFLTEAGALLRWESVPNRTYFLERRTHLGAPSSFQTLATNLVGQFDTTTYLDTNTVGTSFYYRVGVEE